MTLCSLEFALSYWVLILINDLSGDDFADNPDVYAASSCSSTCVGPYIALAV
jgi:hypothetical protein